jgi:hypothetical protein
MDQPQTDYDSPWKEVIERYFKAFMAFFFPDANEEINWSHGYEFLDKELQQVVRDAALGRRLADKLVKVWRQDGVEVWVLIHVEVQGQAEADFAKRMYTYNYRLFDRYNQQVASLAILGDESPIWRPQEFGYKLFGCKVSLQFPTVKLLDYAEQWSTLEKSANPFALVVMAHLKAQATRDDPLLRLEWKLILVKSLYQRGYTKQDILELFRFIDWIMVLPEDLDQRFEDELAHFEEEKRMTYVTSIERRALKRGLEQGALQSSREDLLAILAARFGAIPESLQKAIAAIDDLMRLKTLLPNAATVSSLSEFEMAMERVG